MTGNFRDTWGGRNLNQADHIAVGKAVVDAVRDAGNRWVFPEQLGGDLEPWGGVGAVWAFGSPQSGHAVDTTDTFDSGRYCDTCRLIACELANTASDRRPMSAKVRSRPFTKTSP